MPRTRAQAPSKALALLLAAALTGGCAGPSVWERTFAPEVGVTPAESDADPAGVVVRDAPWERVGEALDAERRAIAGSDTHRTEWPESLALDNEHRLLAALQLPPDIDARLIGRSRFRTTSPLNPDDGALAAFAASIGADYAVWSRQLLGKAETIEREPVFIHRHRSARTWDPDRQRHAYRYRSQPETVWVPVVVERDEVRWVVFYVRDEG